jgi:RHS repeat-associated protein
VNDADTGLVYMQQRYYDPVAGRFLSVDPVVTDANSGKTFNRFSYAANNPYKYIDPDGRNEEKAYGAAVALIGLSQKQEEIWKNGERAAGFFGQDALSGFEGMRAAQGLASGGTTPEAILTAVVGIGSSHGARAGKDHTQAAKRNSLQNNKNANGGVAICPDCKGKMNDPQQSKAGVPKDMKQAEGDHIIPKSKGGNGATAKDLSNLEMRCATCNNIKSDN